MKNYLYDNIILILSFYIFHQNVWLIKQLILFNVENNVNLVDAPVLELTNPCRVCCAKKDDNLT